MKKTFYRWALLALTATACGAPELSNSEAAAGAPTLQALGGYDSTAPVSTFETIPGPSLNGEYHSDVSVVVYATDDASGVEAIYFSMTGAETASGVVPGDEAWLPIINTEGVTTITFYAKDVAGNYEAAKTLTVNVTPEPEMETCSPVTLNDFNLFVLGDYTGGLDVLGKVAAGGNISMQYFSVGAGLTEDDDRSNVLVAGGNLNISYGWVNGDVHYAGSLTADETVSFHGGSLSQGEAIDFAERGQELMALSERLVTDFPTNGTTTIESWGGVMLEGSDPDMNFFEVDASAFASAVYFSINVPEGAMAVVNVLGETASFSNFGNGYTGVDATSVLFNFPTATSINASNYGFVGTVLAPYAHVTFNNGAWDGGIYAASFSGNAEGHIAPLRDFETCNDGGGPRW